MLVMYVLQSVISCSHRASSAMRLVAWVTVRLPISWPASYAALQASACAYGEVRKKVALPRSACMSTAHCMPAAWPLSSQPMLTNWGTADGESPHGGATDAVTLSVPVQSPRPPLSQEVEVGASGSPGFTVSSSPTSSSPCGPPPPEPQP